MIEIKQVTRAFGSKKALDDVTLNFEAGKTHVLLGSSGCGKTSLLRAILGLLQIDQGSIKVAEKEVSPQTQKEISGSIGYVVQSGGLFPHLTAEENVSLVARTRGWKSKEIDEVIQSLSQLVSLREGVLDRYPRQLSGGQCQRVSLMRALMLNPKVLLLDEPLGALDPIVRYGLQEELLALFARLKKTVVFVTHDLAEAAHFGHTITLMNEGRVIQHGPFEELTKNPKDDFVTEFINAQRPPPEIRANL